MRLSDATKNIICSALNIENISEVMNISFNSLPDNVNHDELAAYTSKGRGSVRLATGRFFSPNESKEWAEKVHKLELP